MLGLYKTYKKSLKWSTNNGYLITMSGSDNLLWSETVSEGHCIMCKSETVQMSLKCDSEHVTVTQSWIWEVKWFKVLTKNKIQLIQLDLAR